MSTLPQAIRTVKTPEIPRDDDPTAYRRVRAAMTRLREQLDYLEREVADPDLLEDADAALADVLYDVRYPRPATPKGPRDCGYIPIALAASLASGSWRRDQP